MIKFIVFIFLLLLINPLYSQVKSTNNSIILQRFAALPHLIPKGVTKAKIFITLDSHTDTINVKLDSLHRITQVKSYFLNCSIQYEDKLITMQHQESFPNYFFPLCYDFVTEYHLNDKGRIIFSTMNCNAAQESKKESVKHYYVTTISNHNSITNSIMIAPTSEVKNGHEMQNSYQLLFYNDVENMMYYNYATNMYKLVYSVDSNKSTYDFCFRSIFSGRWLNCRYSSKYDVNKKFEGLLQTSLYNTENVLIGELTVVEG